VLLLGIRNLWDHLQKVRFLQVAERNDELLEAVTQCDELIVRLSRYLGKGLFFNGKQYNRVVQRALAIISRPDRVRVRARLGLRRPRASNCKIVGLNERRSRSGFGQKLQRSANWLVVSGEQLSPTV
jgi:hypothetical protein